MNAQEQQQQHPPVGGVIQAVEPASIAEALALRPGDVVLAVDGQPLRDIIDYRFAIADDAIDMLVRTAEGEVLFDIEKDADDDLGIIFAEPLFDRLHRCTNACTFCFITQMPPGMRDSLYVKDDDYRLSFLYGNFITLTNLCEADWQRIEQQHLSPLYISVHATEQRLRGHLLGRPSVPDILAQLRRLGRAGIQVETQIVACPGINDGPALRQTIQELADLFPTVHSIAVVPVGLTRYREPQPARAAAASSHLPALRCYTPDEARQVLAQVWECGERMRARRGARVVYPADEFVLLSGEAVPPASFYDDYPQYFNGVGMTRDFLDDWQAAARHLPPRLARGAVLRVALVCGTLFAPIVREVQQRLNQIDGLVVEVVPVVNHFFGPTVTVSGLLTGQDVVAVLAAHNAMLVVLPRAMFDHEGHLTLDDYTVQQIEMDIRQPVAVAGTANDLLRVLRLHD